MRNPTSEGLNGGCGAACPPARRVEVPEDLAAAPAEDATGTAGFDALKGSERYSILYRLHQVKGRRCARRRWRGWYFYSPVDGGGVKIFYFKRRKVFPAWRRRGNCLLSHLTEGVASFAPAGARRIERASTSHPAKGSVPATRRAHATATPRVRCWKCKVEVPNPRWRRRRSIVLRTNEGGPNGT